MMYANKLAVAVKSAGKVLREFNQDTVHIPFGKEYSIFIKNLNSVRVVAKVSIDGQAVDDDNEGFVVGANSSIDIERFLKNGNLNKGNRFKFIERSNKIEEHRGIEVEDGLIRVEFQFEQVVVKDVVHHYTTHVHHNNWYPYPYRWYLADAHHNHPYNAPIIGSARGTVSSTSTYNPQSDTKDFVFASNAGESKVESDGPVHSFVSNEASEKGVLRNASLTVNDVGITVPGSVSDQSFVNVDGFPLEEESHVIVLKLLGKTTKGKRVKKPVTVKTKQKCPSCGNMNKATTKFCAECGTGLEIV